MKLIFFAIFLSLNAYLIAQPESMYFNTWANDHDYKFISVEEDSTYVFMAYSVNTGREQYYLYERYDERHNLIYVRRKSCHVDFENIIIEFQYDSGNRITTSVYKSDCRKTKCSHITKTLYDYGSMESISYTYKKNVWVFLVSRKITTNPGIHMR